MSQTDLSRVKSDLSAIKQAAGIELPFGREDVWMSLFLGFFGVAAAVWFIVPHDLSHRWLGIPFFLILFGTLGGLRYKYRKGTGKSSFRRREYGVLANGLPASLVAIFVVWQANSGADLYQLAITMFFFIGAMFLDIALKNPVRLYYIGFAVPAMLLCLCRPLWQEPKHAQISIGVLVFVGGFATAAIQAWQLKRRVVHHVAD